MSPIRSALVLALVLVLAACTGRPAPATTPGGTVAGSPATKLVVGLGYLPSVQFAQFYLAEQAGYYREAGLEVEFQNKIDPELITLIGQGSVDIGMGDGTSVIPAVSQGIPVRYVATVYARFPSVVFAKESSGIATPADLAGRKLGTPGRYGSSWVMVQALLASADLTPDDVEVELFADFGQRVALEQDVVDAATGFVNNEPVVMERGGTPVNVLRVDEITPLPGPGLVTAEATLRDKREALRAFVAASLRAMTEIQADPEKGLEAAIARVPELGQDRETQRAILEATIETWQSPRTEAAGPGAIDREGWAESIAFMRSLPDSPVAREVSVDELVSEELLPPGP